MKKINTIMILGIITILEIVGDTITSLSLNCDEIFTLDLESTSLWFLYGLYKFFTFNGGNSEDNVKEEKENNKNS